MKRISLAQSAALLIGTGLLVHALMIKVVPAPVFYTWPVVLPCLLLGMAFTAWRWRVHRREGYPFRSGLLVAFGYLVLPFAMAALGWLIVAKSVPWSAAAIAGVPHVESHPFHTHLSRRLPCRHQIEPDRLLDFGPVVNFFCVTPDYFSRHRDDIVRVRLEGQRTVLGFRIIRFEHQQVVGPRPRRSKP